MRRGSFFLRFGTVLVLGAVVAVLALTSIGLAGGIHPATYNVFVQASLSTSNSSYIKLDFAPATGKGTGSATHAIMYAYIDADLAPTESAVDCEISDFDAETKLVTCSVGTVNAGEHAIRYVSITAPDTATAGTGDTFTIRGWTEYDAGQGRGGGGISRAPVEGFSEAAVTVFGEADKNHVAGDCGSTEESVGTTAVNNDDPQATSTELADTPPGVPCSVGWVAETSNGKPAFIASQISVVDVRGNGTVLVTMDVYGPSITVQFNRLKVYYFPNWPDTGGAIEITNPKCADGVIPSGKNACLVSLTKDGNVYHHVIALRALGDPGFGDG